MHLDDGPKDRKTSSNFAELNKGNRKGENRYQGCQNRMTIYINEDFKENYYNGLFYHKSLESSSLPESLEGVYGLLLAIFLCRRFVRNEKVVKKFVFVYVSVFEF